MCSLNCSGNQTVSLEDWLDPPSLRPIKAVCDLYDKQGKIIGQVRLQEISSTWETKITIEVNNQCPGQHGIHIHEYADAIDPTIGIAPRRRPNNHCPGKVNPPAKLFENCCDALGPHYNPYDSPHGSLDNDFSARHVGDMGNILVRSDGRGHLTIFDRLIRLRGRFSVLNRSIVFHKNRDDLGLGGNPESLITGNSGPRIACGIIRQVN